MSRTHRRQWLSRLTKALRRRPQSAASATPAPHTLPSYALSGGMRSLGTVGMTDRNELARYKEMRRNFPVLDVAITKLVRLCGTIIIDGPRDTVQDLEHWSNHLRVNAVRRGLSSWIEVFADEMLHYGRSVSELVLSHALDEVVAIVTVDPISVEFVTDPQRPGRLLVGQRQRGGIQTLPEAVSLVAVWNPQGDNPHGTSLYRSLPFVAEALSVIENATLQAWQRHGAPPYHVNWKPPESFQDPDGTQTRTFMATLQSAFVSALEARTQGSVKDFFSSGDVTIDIIGAKEELLNLQEPFRAFAEQLVAATGLPSWLLGFNWSNTERLSTVQADLLVSHVSGIRDAIMPSIVQLIETRQRAVGRRMPRLSWDAINLKDLNDTARAQVWEEQARGRRIENGRIMWRLGYWTQLQAAQYADETLERVATVYETPPAEEPDAAHSDDLARMPGGE